MKKLTNLIALECAISALSSSPLTEYRMDEVVFSAKEVKEKIESMMESLTKKNTAKPSKSQQENDSFKDDIADLLAHNEPMRATEVAHALELSSGQKAAALLNALVKDGRAARVKGEKGVTLFTSPDRAPVEEQEEKEGE